MTHTDTLVHPDSQLTLHNLGFRQDRNEWIVGRVDTGDFIAIPDIGVAAIRLFQDGHSPRQASDLLAVSHPEEAEEGPINLVPFVEGLMAEGLVATVDGTPIPSTPPKKATFPRVKPHHVSWAQHWALPVLLGAVICTGLIVLAMHPEAIPSPTDLVWHEYNSVVLLTGAIVGWSLIGLHECAHLFTARAAGVPGRITLGTRLQFLVAQTDVTAVWLAPRKARLTVYLAGMCVDVTIAALATIATVIVWPLEGVERFLPVLMMMGVFPLLFQISIFMRTDLYFVFQDLTRCRNLYGDAGAYVRWQLARLQYTIFPWRKRQGAIGPDPSAKLPAHERRVVRGYSLFMSTGIVGALGFFALVSVPVALTFYLQAFRNLTSGDTLGLLDGVVSILITAFFQGLWLYTFVKRRRERKQRVIAVPELPA